MIGNLNITTEMIKIGGGILAIFFIMIIWNYFSNKRINKKIEKKWKKENERYDNRNKDTKYYEDYDKFADALMKKLNGGESNANEA